MREFLLFLYAESPVHAGGADSIDVVDLPIQREATTGYPVIWGQSLKGALRQAAGAADWGSDEISNMFGSPVSAAGASSTAGSISVGDAQLVAMPVPTLQRTFAWVTSSVALGRLARKYQILGGPTPPGVPTVASDRALAFARHWQRPTGEVFGPYVLNVDGAPGEDADPSTVPLASWAERISADALPQEVAFQPFRDKLAEDLVLVGSDAIGALLTECTEQAVRVQLEPDTKTVKAGPFYSEYLPTESILAASLTQRTHGRDADLVELEVDRLRELDFRLIQIGGDETLGKGLMWARLVEAGGHRAEDES